MDAILIDTLAANTDKGECDWWYLVKSQAVIHLMLDLNQSDFEKNTVMIMICISTTSMLYYIYIP